MPTYVLPTLLFRLTDEHPGALEDRADEGIVDIDTYRSLVMQDVSRLLNATPPRWTGASPVPSSRPHSNEGKGGVDLAKFPLMVGSVINYGLDLPVGSALSSTVRSDLASEIALALQRFEPRLERVRVVGGPAGSLESEVGNSRTTGADIGQAGLSDGLVGGGGMSLGAGIAMGGEGGPDLSFVIDAELFAQPVPLELRLQTDVDFVRGSVRVAPWLRTSRTVGGGSPPRAG